MKDSPFAGGIDNDLLVLSRKAGSPEAIDDQWMDNKVRVTGKVGKMAIVEVERELGWDLTSELEVEFEGTEAVLIADSVTRVDDWRGSARSSRRASTPERPTGGRPRPFPSFLPSDTAFLTCRADRCEERRGLVLRRDVSLQGGRGRARRRGQLDGTAAGHGGAHGCGRLAGVRDAQHDGGG
jgi:hypothetical protein